MLADMSINNDNRKLTLTLLLLFMIIVILTSRHVELPYPPHPGHLRSTLPRETLAARACSLCILSGSQFSRSADISTYFRAFNMFSRTTFRLKGASKAIRSFSVAAQVITLLKLC